MEGLDEVEQGVLGQALLVGPGDVAEDARQRVGVRLLDPVEGVLKADADVLVQLAKLAPVAALREPEAVVVGLNLVGQLGAVIAGRAAVLVVPGIGDTLVEEEREEIRLEVRGIDRATPDCSRRPTGATRAPAVRPVGWSPRSPPRSPTQWSTQG